MRFEEEWERRLVRAQALDRNINIASILESDLGFEESSGGDESRGLDGRKDKFACSCR
jgi:hypothetical protein